MAASNPFQRELCAVALLGAGVFLGVSLATYSPSDPVSGSLGPLSAVYRPDQVEYPAPEEIVNSCGRWGALAADLLLTGIGAGAYYAIGSILVLSGFLFLRASLEGPLFRFAGWLGSLAGVSTLAALTLPDWSPGPMVGAGGYVGALGAGLLLHHFALFGSLLLAGSFVVGGLMMCSDHVFPAMLRWSLGGFLAPLLRRRETAETRVDAGRPQRTPNKSPPVRIAPTKSKKERAAVAAAEAGAAAESAAVGASVSASAVGGKSRSASSGNFRVDDDSSPSILPIRGRGKNAGPTRDDEDSELDGFDDDDTATPASSGRGGGRHAATNPATAKATAPATSRGRSANAGGGSPSANADASGTGRNASRVADRNADRVADRNADREGDIEAETGANSTVTNFTVTNSPGTNSGGANSGGANGAQGPHFKSRSSHDARAAVLAELQEDGREPVVDDYELPGIDLLVAGEDVDWESQEKEVRRKAKVLEKTFADFGFQVRVVEIETGPVIAQYEVELEAGLRLSKITALADDLAIALRVPSVRIVAPIPGKNTVGIEVPNEERQVVRLREVIEETNGKIKKMRIPLFLGKDVSGNPLAVDLSTLPHLLIAGRTGTGKSVCLNAIISSILMTRRPDEVRMIMIDPKMVELSGYGRLPHLMHPVVTDMKKAEAILAWGVEKMEERYALLARAGVRHISNFNQLGEEELRRRLQPEDDAAWASIPKQLPFIVIVADEIADMMMTAGKEVEQHIIRLAQKSRAVGIHLILATQKPTVDVITGLIKSNLPARISFQVASRVDSRVVLDEMGADKLLGNGDMLFLWPGTSTLLRGQGTYLGDDEITRLVDCCSRGRQQNFVSELVNMKVESENEGDGGLMEKLRKRDELYESAVDVVIREGRGSCSLLQRALGIGYGRAARLIDFMAEDGIVGTYAGSQAREVLMTVDEWEQLQNESSAGAADSDGPSRDGGKQAARTTTAGSSAASPTGPRRTVRQSDSATAAAPAGAGMLNATALNSAALNSTSPSGSSGSVLSATGTTGLSAAALPKVVPTVAGATPRPAAPAAVAVTREPNRAISPMTLPPGVAFAPPSELDEFVPDALGGYGAGDTNIGFPTADVVPAFAPEAGVPPRVPLAGNLPPSVALNGPGATSTSRRLGVNHLDESDDDDAHDELRDRLDDPGIDDDDQDAGDDEQHYRDLQQDIDQQQDRDREISDELEERGESDDPDELDERDVLDELDEPRELEERGELDVRDDGNRVNERDRGPSIAVTGIVPARPSSASPASNAANATGKANAPEHANATGKANAPGKANAAEGGENRGRAGQTRRGVITFPRLMQAENFDETRDTGPESP